MNYFEYSVKSQTQRQRETKKTEKKTKQNKKKQSFVRFEELSFRI